MRVPHLLRLGPASTAWSDGRREHKRRFRTRWRRPTRMFAFTEYDVTAESMWVRQHEVLALK
jgi:polyphosphate kinase 2 (PPK2 family)